MPQSYLARAERRRREPARHEEAEHREEYRRTRTRAPPRGRSPPRSRRPPPRSRTPPQKRARSESHSPPRPSHRSWGVPGSWGVPVSSPPPPRHSRRPPSRPRADHGEGSSQQRRGTADRGEGSSRGQPPCRLEFVLVEDFPGVRIPLQVPDLQFAIEESTRLNNDPDVPPSLRFSPLGHLLVHRGLLRRFLPSLWAVLDSPLVTAKGSLPADLHFLDFLVQELNHPHAEEVFRRLALLFDSAGSFARRTRLEHENLIPRDESDNIGLDYQDVPTAGADATMENDSDVVVVEHEGIEVDDDEPPSPSQRRPSMKSRGKRRASGAS
ncbi:hypothetical protein C8F01DRAFT_1152429 [Mycena amicta]|nr:hypothetical protein C8F01DRAFT_1152429 [Mycena amicta]